MILLSTKQCNGVIFDIQVHNGSRSMYLAYPDSLFVQLVGKKENTPIKTLNISESIPVGVVAYLLTQFENSIFRPVYLNEEFDMVRKSHVRFWDGVRPPKVIVELFRFWCSLGCPVKASQQATLYPDWDRLDGESAINVEFPSEQKCEEADTWFAWDVRSAAQISMSPEDFARKDEEMRRVMCLWNEGMAKPFGWV